MENSTVYKAQVAIGYRAGQLMDMGKFHRDAGVCQDDAEDFLKVKNIRWDRKNIIGSGRFLTLVQYFTDSEIVAEVMISSSKP
jgi:hypothetical protein